MNLYRSLLALLASHSADPAEVDREHPRAAAAVAAAYASFTPDAPPEPPSPPPAVGCGCGSDCVHAVYKPDGKIEMPCERDCGCGCRLSGEEE